MNGFETCSHGDSPELALVFRLERNGFGNNNDGSRQNNIGINGDVNIQGTEEYRENNSGFEYRAATKFLREQPEQVQYVLYKGRRTKDKHLLQEFPVVSNKSSMESNDNDNENTQDYKFSGGCGRFLYSPLRWACIETTQEEEALEFLSTIRDIDPTLFLLQDDQGELPIEGECILNASIPMIRFLLEIYLDHDFVCPNGPKMTEDNFNALTCLCGSCWGEEIRQAHQDIVSGRRIVTGRNVLEDNLGIDDHFWALILLLTKAFYHKTIDDVRERKEEEQPNANNSSDCTYSSSNNNNITQMLHIFNEHGERTIQFRLLHACAGIDWFPPNLLQLLVAAFPQTLLDRDEDGNLPIHVAASGVFSSYKIDATWDDFGANSGYQKTTIDIFLEANPELASIPDGEGKFPLELTLESEHCRPWEDGGIGSILEAYPKAAKIRSLAKAKLPLEIALENHRDWNDGTAALLEAYPGAAGLCNPSIGKFPLELTIEKEYHFDEGIYGLLEASPAVVIQVRDRCFDGETDDQDTISASTTRKIHNNLPIFARAAVEDCSVSVIYKILRMWPQSCKVEKCKTGSSNKEQLEAIASKSRSCVLPAKKRQKTL
uniref:Uncharacterized protein n=1 Tax=Pseudo-nitzschia australis TaxID=44445 RepID=A0A7S4EIR2_9STRA|mmetsp:Transcript_16988/g.37133  ORF Transcript_16988/g.37133 Transcript_16988/m.37133 type:complete len:603 (+) Transcript_16988:72-1880(+)